MAELPWEQNRQIHRAQIMNARDNQTNNRLNKIEEDVAALKYAMDKVQENAKISLIREMRELRMEMHEFEELERLNRDLLYKDNTKGRDKKTDNLYEMLKR